jgi:hypothetical protein
MIPTTKGYTGSRRRFVFRGWRGHTPWLRLLQNRAREPGTDTCQFVWTISMLEKFGFLLNDCYFLPLFPRCMVTRLEKQRCILDHTVLSLVFALRSGRIGGWWGWRGWRGWRRAAGGVEGSRATYTQFMDFSTTSVYVCTPAYASVETAVVDDGGCGEAQTRHDGGQGLTTAPARASPAGHELPRYQVRAGLTRQRPSHPSPPRSWPSPQPSAADPQLPPNPAC